MDLIEAFVEEMVRKHSTCETRLVVWWLAPISGFCSFKRLWVFLLLHGWDASPSQGDLQH